MRNAPLIISGPSGVGKSTLIRQLRPYGFQAALSTTTREPRPTEIPGVDYEFTDREAFSRSLAQGEFVWHNEIFGNQYGYRESAVRRIMESNHIPVVTIYTPYVEDFQNAYPDAKSVYLLPESAQFLANRLGSRDQTEEEFNFRLHKAVEDIELYRAQYAHIFDKEIVINSDNNFPVIEGIRSLYPEEQRDIEGSFRRSKEY